MLRHDLLVKEQLIRTVKEHLSTLGIKYTDISKCLKCSFEDYSQNYMNVLIDGLMKREGYDTNDKDRLHKIWADVAIGKEDKHFVKAFKTVAEEIEHITPLLDNIWSCENSIVFTLDINKAKRLPIQSNIGKVDLTEIGDFLITFKDGQDFAAQSIWVMKSEDVITLGNKDMTGTLLALVLGYKGFAYQFTYVKDIYPRMLSLGENDCSKTHNCKGMVGVNVKLSGNCVKAHEVYEEKLSFKVNDSNRVVSACKMSNLNKAECKMYKQQLTPDQLVNIATYVYNVYTNRANFRRKNGRLAEAYTKMPQVGVVSRKVADGNEEVLDVNTFAKDNGAKYVLARDIVIDTRDDGAIAIHRTGTSHEFHASPRQHVRTSHTRKLKSGKIVEVKSCIVNGNKEKASYEIK